MDSGSWGKAVLRERTGRLRERVVREAWKNYGPGTIDFLTFTV